MPTYAYPTLTETLGNPEIDTLREALNKRSVPQAYRNALLMQFLLGAAKEPGLEIQGQDLKLPGGLRPKSKMMSGRNATCFVNFEDGLTGQWVEGLEPLNTQLADGPTECNTNFAYLTCSVGIGGIEEAENSGPMKRLDILMERQDQEMRTTVRLGETALWSTNTDTIRGTQGRWAGIRHKISTAPTSGTFQGLSRSTFTPFRNQYNASGGSFATGGLDFCRAMYFLCADTNAMEPPHLILTEKTIANAAVKALEGIHRVVGSLNGQDLSASKLPTIQGVPMVFTADCPSGYMYWLNFDYMVNIKHEKVQWTTKIAGEPNDQWINKQMRWFYGAAPMMISRPEKFGVVAGITA